MSNWKIGGTVICINNGLLPHQQQREVGKLPALRLNGKYVVNNITQCKCGSISLDVGLINSAPGGCIRCVCGELHPSSDIHWCNEARFRSPEDVLEERIKAAVEAGDDALVDQLLDELNE